MKRTQTKSPQVRSSLIAGRCTHISRNGKPCRYLAVSPEIPFCKTHLPPPPPGSPADLADLADAMEKDGQDFDTPEGVRNVLALLFYALLEGRISERRAGILSYIAQGILHSQRAMAQHEKAVAQQKKLAATDSYDRATDAFHKLLLAIPGGGPGVPGLLPYDQFPKPSGKPARNSADSHAKSDSSHAPNNHSRPAVSTEASGLSSASDSSAVFRSSRPGREASIAPTTAAAAGSRIANPSPHVAAPSLSTSSTPSTSSPSSPRSQKPSPSASSTSPAPSSTVSEATAPSPTRPSSSSTSLPSPTSSPISGSVLSRPVICNPLPNFDSCIRFVPLPRRRNHPAWRGT